MAAANRLRNIAIIAHVDHGKTTLVDQLLKQSSTLDERTVLPDRAMDSNDLERERGITILAKNTAIRWRDWRINIVDTPGHADFGGEVERVLSMVDSVLLLVDAVDGPMPQTRFVTQKAFARGITPIVVINKIDRDGARPEWVLDQTFDLFDRLGATNEQLDFPVIYASALNGYAGATPDVRAGDMTPLFEAIVTHVPPPAVDPLGAMQLQVSSLGYDPYVGVLGIGRVSRGTVTANTPVSIVAADGSVRIGRLVELYGFMGLTRQRIESGGCRRHRRLQRRRQPAYLRHALRPQPARGPAPAAGGRADHQHDLPGQQVAVRRQGRQVPHQPPDPRPAGPGAAAQRRPAGRGHR